MTEEAGGLEKQYEQYQRSDMDQDTQLDEQEFLFFFHPEHNPKTIKEMAEDMITNFDKNEDKVRYFALFDLILSLLDMLFHF